MSHWSCQTNQIFEQLERNGGSIPMYNDIYHVANGQITDDDMVLMFSMDGAQLYCDKESDCWIYVWNTDSFLYTGFHHLAALQKEGLCVWDAQHNCIFSSHPFLYVGAADGPGSVHFSSLVGHHGAFPCCLYCPIKGQHKPGVGHYYPALLKPNNYNIEGCDHDDISPDTIPDGSPLEYAKNLCYLLQSRNAADYKYCQKETGISNLGIFSGLSNKHCLPIPSGFPGDSMHVPTLNLGELFVPLWHGTFHSVAASKVYLPSSFDRPPCNIALKVSSGYKAKEWQGYFYGLKLFTWDQPNYTQLGIWNL
ncbi:hypothetical protein BDQ12DRAFT_701656 [Crucibulum laeve]|uniref:Uncharacterized protein n=1 Tax=Crucibulum laeve TaxID=68775 RepID=A0A5C3LEF0_9AGAR|nr:hypothetical protein BDQ12DRAFT_701656 [Crucibulum laeve]